VPAPLNASATTVGSLMSGSTFEVPAFQREYAWEDDQVKEFWNDLSHAVSLGPYFLGLIILTGEEKRKQVVDGQQRLLTITLLAAALRHAAVAVGRRALAERLQSTLLRSLDYATDKVLPRIILTDPRADATLQAIIETGTLDAALEVTEGSSSERLWQAYKYLRDQLPNNETTESFRELGAWAEFINEQLYVAVFEHPDEAAAWQRGNTRGKQLTTADLLKNYVLRKTPEEMRWQRYQQWYDMAQQFEPLGNQNFIQFIRHVINLQAGYILPKDLYNYISQRGEFVAADVPDVSEIMDELQKFLPLYLQLVDPTTEGPADSAALDVFVALNELGITAVRPLVLAVSTTDGSVGGMQYILQLIVKRMIVGNLGSSSVERKFADAAKVAYMQRSWEPAVVSLKDMNHPREDFISQLTKRSYNKSTLAFIRRSFVFESTTPPASGTLQYIRPRQPLGDAWLGFSDEESAFWGSTLGNSILVSLDKRPHGATTWDGVRENLLPSAIPNEDTQMIDIFADWTPEIVEQVGARLAEVAADVWY